MNFLWHGMHQASLLLQAHLVSAVEEFVNSGAAPADRMIRDLIECEHSYINTDHPSFIGGSRAIAQVCSGIHCQLEVELMSHELAGTATASSHLRKVQWFL